MTLPNFLVIGAARSGTTAFCAALARHPEIFFSRPKELHFFTYPQNYARGLDWYEQFFAQATSRHTAIGEGSQTYTMLPGFPQTAERIAAVLPHARLFYLVRHPIARIISNWRMVKRRLPQTGEFVGELRNPEKSYYYVDRSRYAYQLAHYRRYFPVTQVQVLFLEDLTAAPAAFYRQSFEFLGVNPHHPVSLANTRQNANDSYRREQPLLRALKKLPGWERARRLIPSRHRKNLRKALTEEIAPRACADQDTIRWLADQLRAETRDFLLAHGKPADFWSLETADIEPMFDRAPA
jgi:hypothetical protein